VSGLATEVGHRNRRGRKPFEKGGRKKGMTGRHRATRSGGVFTEPERTGTSAAMSEQEGKLGSAGRGSCSGKKESLKKNSALIKVEKETSKKRNSTR